MRTFLITSYFVIGMLLFAFALDCAAQTASAPEKGADTAATPKPRVPKTFFRDQDGNLISNNEFVDLRLANPAGKDPATQGFTEDGDVEFKIARPPQEGTEAPLFEAWTVDGKFIKADDLKGKVVVLNFWFIGCPGCMGERLDLNELSAKFKDDTNVLFIAIAPDTAQAIRQYTAKYPMDYRLIGSARSLVNLYKFQGFPRNIVIGKDGKIAYWRTTVHAWDKFESVIRTELAKY
jgi:peroxiredoxin